jgi:hypothetical protein
MRILMLLTIALPALACADAPGPNSSWQLETVEDPSGYGSIETLYQDSSRNIGDEAATGKVTPRLEFRCSPGDSSVTARINWMRFISSFSTEVGFKVDGGRFSWMKWKMDQSEQTTISPSTSDSQKLIDALTAGSELLVEVSPYSMGPETAEFSLAGFEDSLAALAALCQ